MRQWALTLLLFALPLFGQNSRYDFQATTTSGVGNLIPVLAIPGASISFYTGCTTLPCATKATTYESISSGSSCPSTAQVVWQLPLGQTCTSTADAQGNFGGYFQSGNYQFTETVSGKTFGPYAFTISGAGSTVALWADPRNFGAKCDGVTDDSGAIQAAVNSVAGSATPVAIPAICGVASQITLPSGAAGACQWHFIGSSQGAQIKAVSGFPTSDTAMLFRPAGSVTCPESASIENLTLNANQIATQALTVQEQRVLNLTNLTVLDATGGTVGAEVILGISGGSAREVGLHSIGLFIDNSNTIFGSGGPSARPNYGLIQYQNVDDSDQYNTVIDHIKIAGIANYGTNNSFTKFHPWGFGPGGSPANTWPEFGFEDHSFTADLIAPEFDTVQLAGVDSFNGQTSVLGGELVCNDGGSGSACQPFIVQAESGAKNFFLYGTKYQAGTLSAPNSPINWIGTPDTGSTYVTQWGVAQLGGRSGLHLATIGNSTTLDSSITNGPAKFLGGLQNNPASTATSGANVLPSDQTNTASVWSGTAALGATWAWKRFTSPTGVPTFDQYILTPPCGNAAYPGTGNCAFGVANTTTPTSANFVAPDVIIQGACQSCTNNKSTWFWRQAYGTGANPTDELDLFNDNGSTGAKSVGMLFNMSFNTIKSKGLFQSVTGNFASSCTMSSGACSAQPFIAAFNSTPICTCSWNGSGTLTGALKCPATTSTITPASSVGTDTAVVGWICVGNPN